MDQTQPTPGAELSVDIIQRIQGGDQAAWETLYMRYRDPLLFSIRARLGSGLRARIQSEDILHSVIIDAMGDLQDFEPQKQGALLHYLHVVVLNKIRTKAAYFGALKRKDAVPLSPSLLERLKSPAMVPTYLEPVRFEKLEKALKLLPEAMREVVLLRKIENLSNQEAATVLDRSPEATSKLFNRAIARLGLIMEKEVHQDE